VVAGVIFFIVRAFFALIPGLAGRAPIKKWAALAALLVTGFISFCPVIRWRRSVRSS